jgi:hypothetical protein
MCAVIALPFERLDCGWLCARRLYAVMPRAPVSRAAVIRLPWLRNHERLAGARPPRPPPARPSS